jgi:hypothetical protein
VVARSRARGPSSKGDNGPRLRGAGGALAENLSERSVALPPLSTAGRMISGLRVAGLLAGLRGQPPGGVAGNSGEALALR